MERITNPKIFLSFYSEEKTLAERFKRFLEDHSNVGSIFFSDDPDSISPSEDGLKKILKGLRKSDHQIVLAASAKAASRPWINFEIGGMMVQPKKKIMVIQLSKLEKDAFSTTSHLQIASIWKEKELLQGFKKLQIKIDHPDWFRELEIQMCAAKITQLKPSGKVEHLKKFDVHGCLSGSIPEDYELYIAVSHVGKRQYWVYDRIDPEPNGQWKTTVLVGTPSETCSVILAGPHAKTAIASYKRRPPEKQQRFPVSPTTDFEILAKKAI